MKIKLSITSVLLFLTACNLVPNFQRPDVETPAQWHDASLTQQKSAVDPQWWRSFGSAELNHLITESLLYNNDLAAARQRIEQARAQAKIAGANLWPSIGLQGDFIDTRNNSGDSQKETGQFSVAYEVDLWGANRARRDAGSARLLSSVFTRDALQLVVMSNVGQAYFNLLALAERKRIATEFLENVADVLAIVEARHQAGAVSALDVAQQKTELATARASLDLAIQQYTLAENALAILLGHPPQTASFNAERFSDMLLPTVNALQPASLLERRPDVRQIEMELIAANADIGVARAAFYPKLQLNLDAVLASPQPAGVALAMASSLAQPLFQGGRLEGGLENAQARNAELVETYRKTILTAFKEVEDAAAIRSNSTRRLQALADALDMARLAYQLSLDRYRLGAIDYQTLLSTQRSLLNTENSQVQARQDVLVAMVQLYQALGGGWSSKQP
ncbi:MAG: efflux transporter outer membrane subunit [Methylobacter sp.]|uniref:Efflux transporter outer membrane subunit n=1 Tax=Candidatus Methylobacter titanis TaxID=3053457 RepID=A0AA43Q5U7_9GAMM|nr:efflux transporter outer membrane subunit [Candidatus Methylobacter titanis]